jgi:opacity protein-like surface antigen
MTRVLTSALAAILASVSPSLANDDVYDWSGLFVAVHLKGEKAEITGRFQNDTGGFQLPSGLGDVSSATYGVSAGYNFHVGNFVLGVEGSYSGKTAGKKDKVNFGRYRQTREIEDTLKLGPRIGLGWGHWHVYATAGVASSGVTVVTQDIGILTGADATVNRADDQVFGQYVGAGVEFAFGKNIILGAQIDRTNLSGVSSTWRDAADERLSFSSDDPVVDAVTFKAGIKF